MIYGEILKILHFYHFDSDPRFPPFLLYVRWKSGDTFVRRCFRDVLSITITCLCNILRFFTTVKLVIIKIKKYLNEAVLTSINDVCFTAKINKCIPL